MSFLSPSQCGGDIIVRRNVILRSRDARAHDARLEFMARLYLVNQPCDRRRQDHFRGPVAAAQRQPPQFVEISVCGGGLFRRA